MASTALRSWKNCCVSPGHTFQHFLPPPVHGLSYPKQYASPCTNVPLCLEAVLAFSLYTDCPITQQPAFPGYRHTLLLAPASPERQFPESNAGSRPGMPALTWWLVGVGTGEYEPSPTSIAHLAPQHVQELQAPRGNLSLLWDLQGLGSPACLGHPLLLQKEHIGESWLRVRSAGTISSAVQLVTHRSRWEGPGRLLLTAWPYPGMVWGKFSQCGKVEGEAQARPTRCRGFRLFQVLCTYLGPHQDCPCHPSHLPPSPTTYHPPAFGPSLSSGASCAWRSHAPLPPWGALSPSWIRHAWRPWGKGPAWLVTLTLLGSGSA